MSWCHIWLAILQIDWQILIHVSSEFLSLYLYSSGSCNFRTSSTAQAKLTFCVACLAILKLNTTTTAEDWSDQEFHSSGKFRVLKRIHETSSRRRSLTNAVSLLLLWRRQGWGNFTNESPAAPLLVLVAGHVQSTVFASSEPAGHHGDAAGERARSSCNRPRRSNNIYLALRKPAVGPCNRRDLCRLRQSRRRSECFLKEPRYPYYL